MTAMNDKVQDEESKTTSLTDSLGRENRPGAVAYKLAAGVGISDFIFAAIKFEFY